jgi:putative endonuclease
MRRPAGQGLSEHRGEPIPLGPRGEDYARRRLEQHGWKFIAANWHCRSGELDLVMQDGMELVFVEVKTRRGDFSGRAEEGISANKARRLLLAGEWFIAEHPELDELIWRVDLVAITVDDANEVLRYSHVRNAVLTG